MDQSYRHDSVETENNAISYWVILDICKDCTRYAGKVYSTVSIISSGKGTLLSQGLASHGESKLLQQFPQTD